MSQTQSLWKFRQCLGDQIDELQELKAVYPEKIKCVNHGIVAYTKEFVDCMRDEIPKELSYTVTVTIPEGSVDLMVHLPLKYPEKKYPEVYVSSNLHRTKQKQLNDDLAKELNNREPGQPTVYQLLIWLHENLATYFKEPKRKLKRQWFRINEKKGPKFARYSIFTHHIYDTSKRKEMEKAARDNGLSGFCLPGKPGIICVEGLGEDCEFWWQQIKAWSSAKILLKSREEEELFDRDVDSLRKFAGFQELSLPKSSKTNDMGQLLGYLTKHNCQHIFKRLFGVKGRAAKSAKQA